MPRGLSLCCRGLAAARSRRGSDMPPACHSIPRRRCATPSQTLPRRQGGYFPCPSLRPAIPAPLGRAPGAPASKAARCIRHRRRVAAFPLHPQFRINPTVAFIKFASACQWSVLTHPGPPVLEGHPGIYACAYGLVSAYRTAGTFDNRRTSRRRRRCRDVFKFARDTQAHSRRPVDERLQVSEI